MQTRRPGQRKLGTTGPEVSAIGLGAMGMSDAYGPADRDESLATIDAAVEAETPRSTAALRKLRRRATTAKLSRA